MPHPPNIPLTRQTDERNFPQHDPEAPWGQSGHPYPKRINREFTEDDIEPWKKKHVQYDAGTRTEYFNERRPQARRVLASGKIIPGQWVPVIVTQEMIDYLQLKQNVGDELEVSNAEELAKVRGFLGQEQDTPPVSITALVQEDKTESQVERLKRQNAELEAELERNALLHAKLEEQRSQRKSVRDSLEDTNEHIKKAQAQPLGQENPPPSLDDRPVKKKGRPKGARNKKQVVQSLMDINSDVAD